MSPSASPADAPDPFVGQLLAALEKHRDGHAPSDEAFVVSVYGEWGVGKTYCLRSVEQALHATLTRQLQGLDATQAPPPGSVLVVPVRFDAWRYERDEHLVVPLLKTLEERLLRLAAGEEAALDAATNDFIRRNRQLGTTLLNAGRALALVGQSLLGSVSAKLSLGVAEAKLDGKQLIELYRTLRKTEGEKASQGWLARTLSGRRPAPAGPDAAALLSQASLALGATQCLERLTQGEGGVGLRLVVLVDDLDRCLPEKAVQVLESIKLFLNVKGYSFVLAVDDEVVERGIAYRYRDYKGAGEHDLPISGAQYLEKIVHLPLTVPRWTAERARAHLRSAYPDLYGGDTPTPAQQAALACVIAAVPLVPRKLIRLSEALQFERQRFERSQARAEHWDGLHMLRIVALQQLHPNLYRLVREQATRYWRLFRAQRDPAWELLHYPDPRKGVASDARIGLRDLERLAGDQGSEVGGGDDVTLNEISLLLGAIDRAARQRGAGDPLALFQLAAGEAPPKPADLLGDYTQPLALFHALYFRGEPVPAQAERVSVAPAPGASEASLPVAAVSDAPAAVQALLQADGDSRREAIERLGLRGRVLPTQVFSALVEQARAQPDSTLLSMDWLRDIASVVNDAQLQLLYERGELLQRWSDSTAAPAESA